MVTDGFIECSPIVSSNALRWFDELVYNHPKAEYQVAPPKSKYKKRQPCGLPFISNGKVELFNNAKLFTHFGKGGDGFVEMGFFVAG